jgi:hypothetical protein
LSSTGKITSGGNIQVVAAGDLTWGGDYGAGIPVINGTSGVGFTFYPGGSTTGAVGVLNASGLAVTGALSATTTLQAKTGTTNPASSGALTGLSMGFDSNAEVSWIQSERNSLAETRSLQLNPNGGNVGIGEVSPQGALQITRTTDHANFVLRSDLGAGGGYGGFIRGRSEAFQGGQLDLGTLEANVSTVRMSINHLGNVGVGTASPSYQLELSTDSAAKPSTNTWTIASDARIKTETGEYTKGLDAVLALRPVTYRYNGKAGMIDDGEDKISIIAQEAITAFPECVGSYMVKLEEDDEEETEVLNWNGHALTFALVNSIKELAARLEALENN